MAWAESYAEKQSGMSGLIGKLQEKQEGQVQEQASQFGGFMQLFGGAMAMLIPGGQIAGVGMMTGGLGKIAGG